MTTIKEPSIFVIVDSSLTLIDWTKTEALAQKIADAKNKNQPDSYSIVQFRWTGWGFEVDKTLEPKKE